MNILVSLFLGCPLSYHNLSFVSMYIVVILLSIMLQFCVAVFPKHIMGISPWY